MTVEPNRIIIEPTWTGIKIKNNLINLSNLTRIEMKENKVIFYPLFELEFESRSDAELVFNTVHAIIANKVHFFRSW